MYIVPNLSEQLVGTFSSFFLYDRDKFKVQ